MKKAMKEMKKGMKEMEKKEKEMEKKKKKKMPEEHEIEYAAWMRRRR